MHPAYNTQHKNKEPDRKIKACWPPVEAEISKSLQKKQEDALSVVEFFLRWCQFGHVLSACNYELNQLIS